MENPVHCYFAGVEVTRLKLENLESPYVVSYICCHITPLPAAAPHGVVHNGGRREDFARAERTKAVQPADNPPNKKARSFRAGLAISNWT
jgi:hypothetical protein